MVSGALKACLAARAPALLSLSQDVGTCLMIAIMMPLIQAAPPVGGQQGKLSSHTNITECSRARPYQYESCESFEDDDIDLAMILADSEFLRVRRQREKWS